MLIGIENIRTMIYSEVYLVGCRHLMKAYLERLDYYLVRDYNRNDRVGKSYLEQQYEDSLHGTKAEVRNVTDKTVIF